MATVSNQSLFSDQEAQILVELLETYLGKDGWGYTISYCTRLSVCGSVIMVIV